MTDGAALENKRLSDVMLAMDVVDTLRHRRLLVERELLSDQRDEQLLQRLREIYRSQGMEVGDDVLLAGVEALRQERFTYRPPRKSLAVRLAYLYVQRGKWGLRATVALAVVLLVWLGYTLLVSGPAAQRLEQQVALLNGEIDATTERIQKLEQEANRIESVLDRYADDVPAEYQEVAATKLTGAKTAALHADRLIDSANALNQEANLNSEDFSGRAGKVEEKLKQQQALVSQLDQALRQSRTLLADIDSLKIFPSQLTQLKEAALAVAKERAGAELAKQYFESGMSALLGGQIDQAEAALSELRSLNSQLLQSYSLQVVSREGEQSGVWRVPERNPDARNYYLIVEAVGSDGHALTMTVTNEEDGSRVQTRKWGVRVSERTFRRVAADKSDDGIIQGRRIGEKRRGYLKPEYLVDTNGDAITQW
ncbi:MAG: hypothetical protein KDI18_11265 [Gammaproteobacteria bacterium]|nr:hypothetical protein [Gammaproteobacteria bacterium]MCB1904642.1 hypothetical protein [Gammaproteobacteria bacterium]